MRKTFAILALGGALVAAPAIAQLNVGVGGQGGVNVGVGADAGVATDLGSTVDRVTAPVDRLVGVADRTLNRTLWGDVRLATSADLTAGAVVRDRNGGRIGTVQAVHGDVALVVQGNRAMRVPLNALYHSSKGLVTSLTKADLKARANANANANAHAHGQVRN